jgi:cobalt-zinc-cadmium resistance protein CzcA
VLLAVAAFAATRLGAEFLPRLDEGALTVTTTKLPGISVPSAVEAQTMVERTLMRFPEVQSAVTLGGSSEIPTDPMGVEQSDTFIMLKPQSEWKTAQTQDGLVTRYSAALDRAVPGLTLNWAQPIQMRMDDIIAGVQADVAVEIHGNDLQTLHDTAERVAAVISRVPGAADVAAQQTTGQPYLRVIVKRDAVARYGLNASQVLNVVQSLGGRNVGTVVDGEGQFDIRVRMQPEDRDDVARISALRISNGDGRAVPLSAVADIRMEPGPSSIERKEGRRVTLVQANVRGRDLAGFVLAAQHAVETQVKFPPGYTVSWGGSFKNLQDAMARLYVVVPVSLVVIFALLYLMFGNAALAALIFCNVPFAAIGGIFALWIRGLPFSISAAVGFIALFGIAVLNGVVLVSSIVEMRARGLSAVMAAKQAAAARLRPVLMTATVASLGFLPMAFSMSSGAEVQRPLATVVIGGLVSATLLTLLVLPTVYPWFDRRKDTSRLAQLHERETQFAE